MNKFAICAFFLIALFSTACKQTEDKQTEDKFRYTTFESENIAGKGVLVIIGGGERTDDILKTIIHYGGGTDSARVLVIPFASGEADIVAPFQMNQFKDLGVKADYLICEANEVDLEQNLNKLENVNVVFFSGGDQNKLVKYLEGSNFLEKIHSIYRNGGVVSGTSAGAAVMSEVMITGKQETDSTESPSFDKIQKGDVLTSNGFGFLKNIIIDQHFVMRKRQNRLFSVLKDYPTFRGIGIDEATAIVIKPDNTMSVVGKSQVLVFEPRYKEPDEVNEYIVKILKDGDNYEL